MSEAARPWVLIVDDDEDIRDSIQSLLQLRGYRVDTAADGLAGIERMRKGPPPALVILDFMMPGMNGEEFRAEQLRDPQLAAVPVVLLTGAGEGAGITRMPVERIAKPIDLQLLFDTVARLPVQLSPHVAAAGFVTATIRRSSVASEPLHLRYGTNNIGAC